MSVIWATATDNQSTAVTIDWPNVINIGSFSGTISNFSGFVYSGAVIVKEEKEKPPEIEKAPELDVAFAKRSVARVFRKMGLPG